MFKFHHYAIEVTNPKVVCDFYKEMFGFVVEQKIDLEEEELIFLKLGSFRLEVIRNEHAYLTTNNIHLCFQTSNLQDTMKRFSEVGLKVEEGPYNLSNGWKTVFYKGLAGEVFEILEV
jgi:lactoylglutathione lyase